MLLPQDILLSAPQFEAPENTPEGTMAAMKKRIEGLVKSSKNSDNGTPRVIVLCLSGIRCADVVRELRSVQGKGEVAKAGRFTPFGGLADLTDQLFAKHMKVQEQVDYLRVTRTSIAVGTPARIAKLITEGQSNHM